MLPSSLPRVAGCTFDAVYNPGTANALVGGDWYDAVRLNDGRVLVSIGDVSGSGLDAAVVVGVVRQIMRGVSQLHADPVLILDAADRALRLEYPDVYASAWVGLIDLVEHTIVYASAGHPPPLLVRNDGIVSELEDPTTLLIGLREGHRGIANRVEIDRGAALVLYTDGIIEAGRDILDGSRRMREAASGLLTARHDRPAEGIASAAIPGGAVDDVAILVVQIDCSEAERSIRRWRYNVRDADAAAGVRQELMLSLEAYGFDSSDRANAELIFVELNGNVLKHASSTVIVDVVIDHGGPYSVLHVMDRGGGFRLIKLRPSNLYAESGRGLYLIEQLAVDFTISERFGGGSHARAVLHGGKRSSNRSTPASL